ncbi:SRPBCC family protein [Mycobacterium sp. UM_WGJ]|uniref:SRPBCC family protein n=1 Tax=Mycobacterium sp. UM_WGJ TaxID=1370120 RepID=UPI0003FCB5DB|nr:SRPBCC family protein [Mycobacterium sp. UM_WGJ]
MALIVEQSRTVPATVADTFAGTLQLPLPQLFRRWYGPIPPIKEVRDQTGGSASLDEAEAKLGPPHKRGAWANVGQTRTVVLTGGGSMREELTEVDPPRAFGYRLTDLTGPLAPLVDHVEGRWQFAPAGSGTTVTWSWVIHPRSKLTAPLLPVFGWLWKGYARQALARLSALLEN